MKRRCRLLKINRITATYGRLDHDTIEFHDGLNIIVRPNESGKSTWCSFIRAMLYGVTTSDRPRKGYIPDRIRYKPWSGKNMQGTMELTKNGREIVLQRDYDDRQGPMRAFQATYAGTSVPVEGMNSRNCGEIMIGATRSVFSRSAFVAQGEVTVDHDKELEKKIYSIASTGEENVSYSEADSKLRSWQRARRYSSKGRLPELEKGISDYKKKLSSMQDDLNEVDNLRQQLDLADSRYHTLDHELKQSRDVFRQELEDSLRQAEKDLSKATEDYVRLAGKTKADMAAVRLNPLRDTDPDEIAFIAEEDRKEAEHLHIQQQDVMSAAVPWTEAVVAVILAICGYLFHPNIYILSAVFAVLFGLTGFLYLRKKRLAQAALQKRMEILSKYDVKDEGDIDLSVDRYLSLLNMARASAEGMKESKKSMEDAGHRREDLEKKVLTGLDDSAISDRTAQIRRALDASQLDRERIMAELGRAQGRAQSYGDPLVMKTALENMEQERDLVQMDYDAIMLALDVLRDADEEIQTSFTPQLGACAAEYMAFMTGGRYEGLFINRDFTVQTGSADDSMMRSSEYLSAGTYDLMYLAVRLAVCKMALPGSDPCPIILDDPLVNFDPEREKQAIKLLKELAKERQIILFTCRELSE